MSPGQDVLVIGFGNPLRGDDGAGWRVAELLCDDPRAAGARVLARHQLTPELAEDVAKARLLVLVDASAEPNRAGEISSSPLQSRPRSGALYSHHVDPAGLLELATALYGQAPPAVQVSVGAADLELGTELSALVDAAMGALVETVIELINTPARRDA